MDPRTYNNSCPGVSYFVSGTIPDARNKEINKTTKFIALVEFIFQRERPRINKVNK